MKKIAIIFIKNALLSNGYKYFHFGSFRKDGNILTPDVDLVFDYLDGVWFIYKCERGTIFVVKIYENTIDVLNDIKAKKL